MSRIEKARELRKLINADLQATRKLIRVDELSEEELLDMIDLYESYQVDKLYKEGDILKYDGKLYKVIQEHTSQEDWIPTELPALYLSMMPENVIPEWVQPIGDTGIYVLGFKVIHNGQLWESIHDGNNVWEPGVFGWKEVI